MTNPLIQLVGALSAICGLIVVYFVLIVYMSVRKMGGSLERRHVYVLCSVALLFFFGAVILSIVGANV